MRKIRTVRCANHTHSYFASEIYYRGLPKEEKSND